jgi:U1 small nuclear ribonucleoprotein C
MTGRLTLGIVIEIGHEKAQSVIDSITSSYAAEGQAHANPMLLQNQPGHAFPPFGFPGGKLPMRWIYPTPPLDSLFLAALLSLNL